MFGLMTVFESGFLQSMKKYKKNWSFSSLEKSVQFFGVCYNGKIKLFSRRDVLTFIFIIFYSRLIILLLTIIVPVFDLGMSFRKVKSGKVQKKLRRGLEEVWKFMFKIV